MDMWLVSAFLLSSFFAAVRGDCLPEQAAGLSMKCEVELDDVDEYKGAPALEQLKKENKEHHRLGCCMVRSLERCYKKKLTGDCAGLVEGLVERKRRVLQDIFGSSRCDYKCKDSGHALQPTWILAAAAVVTAVFSYKRNI